MFPSFKPELRESREFHCLVVDRTSADKTELAAGAQKQEMYSARYGEKRKRAIFFPIR